MLESTGEVTHTLLAEAARAAGVAVAGAISVGDLHSYLEAYYRHLAPEDLLPAGPLRAGAIAAEHARVAALRPQGRALVRVRPAGESTALEGSRGVVDVVTDDMPFLVDSITMELARHDLDSYHIVHPQLLVRRDVAGALREVVGPPGSDRVEHDVIRESWMHIEIDSPPGLKAAELEDDLRRVLGDVRVDVAVARQPDRAEERVRARGGEERERLLGREQLRLEPDRARPAHAALELDEALRAGEIAAAEGVERHAQHLLGALAHLRQGVDERGVGLDGRNELRQL